ncbi:homocysteine S-methyltransferase [Lacticaseibacillus sharpeae]|nr:homocysteine S-methyltransferase [Lacticaseibacillus sharpeae]
MQNPLGNLLDQQQYLVNDGAMGTELEKHGVDTNNALWSAMALLKNPEAVIAVHRSYFEAGANIATTDSYQANPQAFAKLGLTEQQSDDLIRQTVQLASAARDEYLANLTTVQRFSQARNLLIAGSVGPYGTFLADGSEYTGAYDLTADAYQDFHWRRMALLERAGADLFALETMPNFAEIKALCALLKDEFPEMTAWVSLSIGTNQDKLADGTPLADVVEFLNDQRQVVALGINCTSMNNVTSALRVISAHTAKPIIVYPNNGDIYDPTDKSWQVNPEAATFSDLVPEWVANGARIVGGCCRTTPADVAEIKQALFK